MDKIFVSNDEKWIVVFLNDESRILFLNQASEIIFSLDLGPNLTYGGFI